jgi:octanoyl-[GcvH]:protein N-octanoyltransferase
MTALHLYAPADAALDVAISHALLEQAAQGMPALRVWTPPPAISFGRLDLLSDRVAAAVAAARSAGYEPVRRLAGGRVAAIGAGTVCVGWAYPSPEMTGMQERYGTAAAVVVGALERAGMPARVGELPGEWCPGSWSVIAGGAKAGGLAQRVVRGGAWAEAVIVVAGAAALAAALAGVQAALGVDWDPGTLRDLAGVTPGAVGEALIAELASRHRLAEEPLPPAVAARAAELRAEHAL